MAPRRVCSAIIILLCMNASHLSAARAEDDDLIERELARAINEPDNRVSIVVEQPIDLVFDALLRRLPEYSDDIARVHFDHGDATVPGTLGVGSLRITTMESGETLAQRIVLFDPPRVFAYFTDMNRSTVNVPIDYSVGHYTFSESADEVTATVSVAYRPSSRLTAFLVRLGFNRAMSNDFERAEAFLNSIE